MSFAAAGAFALGSAVATATTSSPTEVSACAITSDTDKGDARLISPNGNCRRNERKVTWSITGPPGPPGPPGSAGEGASVIPGWEFVTEIATEDNPRTKVGPGDTGAFYVMCPEGKAAISGGIDGLPDFVNILGFGTQGGSGEQFGTWLVHVRNNSDTEIAYANVWAYCATVPPYTG